VRLTRFLFALVVVAGCGGGASSRSALTTTGGSSTCGHAVGVDDAGAGACAVGRHDLTCNDPSGAGCLCVTDDSSCPGCTIANVTCTNQCNSNEYALSCGGPPHFDPGFTYASAPDSCRSVGATPGGNVYYCCPCL
jgi:hypothetical protein